MTMATHYNLKTYDKEENKQTISRHNQLWAKILNAKTRVNSKYIRHSKRSTSSCSDTNDKDYDAEGCEESDEINQKILK